MELHGPNPKGVTTSWFYMIVEFEEPMSPNLVCVCVMLEFRIEQAV